jgi:Tol biopolymer transport system component
MMSNSNVKGLFTILIGVLLGSSCSLSAPSELPIVTSTPMERASPTPQPSIVSSTEQISPTPTERSFVLPGGRLLFTAFSKTGTDITNSYFKYLWLQLPNMTVQDYPYLIGEYPTLDFAAKLSPDSSHLVFEHRVYTQSSGSPFADLMASVHLASLADNKITPIGEQLSNDFITDNLKTGTTISWSANSQVFAFARTSNWLSFDKEKYLYLYDMGSGTVKTLTIQTPQPNAFEVSPDGTQVAFTDLGASPGLSLINADGSEQRGIVDGWVSSNLVWHPDGKRIFFVRDEPVIAIYSVDVSSGAITPVTPRNTNLDSLSLSPDGHHLVYYENGLFVVSADGGDPLQVAGRGVRQWVWSPDSQYIAYVSPSSAIHVMDRLGNGQVEVYHDDQWLSGLIGWLP